jgi:glycosyltransferase involved in cell wall biosynthesis
MKEGGDKLSVYVLTHNSEKYLEQVLERLVTIADDLLVIDSGSTDRTHQIVSRYPCRFVYNAFRSFKDQRNFAQSICHYDHVLALDSDEIVSDEFVQEVTQMKQRGFDKDAYSITRFWVSEV